MHSLIMFGEDGRSGCWNLRFLKDFYDWELEGENDLMDLLYSGLVVERNENCLFWNPNVKVKFSVWSFMFVTCTFFCIPLGRCLG